MHAPTTLDNKIWFALLKAWVSETWNRFDTVIELMNKDEIIKIYRKLRLYERQIRHFESSVVASAPSSVSLTCLSNTSLLVTFAPPYSSGNALLTNYAVSWSASPFTPDSPFSNPAGSSEPTIKTVYVNGHSSTFVIEPLPENAITFVRVAARNIQGLSPWQLASPRCLQLSSWKAINLAKPVVDLDVTASAIKDAQDYFSDRAKRHRDVERVVMGGSSSKVKQMMGVVPDSSHVALKIAPGSDWVPQMKLERTLQPNGIYLASLVFCDENNSVLITAKDETWPIVTLDPAYVGKRQFDEAHDIFTWMARVGAQWNTLHTLLQGVDDFDGLYDSSRAQCEFVKAAAYLRHVLGVELGRLHFRPLTLPNRASVVVTVLRVAKTADISEDLPHKWQTVLPTSLSQPPSLHSSFTTDRNGTENGSDKVSTNSPRPSFIAPDLVSRTSSSDFSVENVQNFGLGAFLNQLNNVWGTNPVAVAPALYHERSSSTASAASVQAAIQHNEPVVSIAATKLHDYTEHLLAAHVSLTTPLRRGVYVAHVMPINRINRVDVVVPRTTPHIVPHSLVREGSSQISAEEWSTLRRVVRRETTLSELQDQLAQLQDAITPSSTIDHFVQISKLQAGIRFCQEVTRATAQLTMSVSSLTSTLTANGSNAHGPHTPTQPSGLSPNTSTERLVLSPDPSSIRSRLQDAATHTAGHRIYCGEPIEVSSQVTLILILPPESTLRHISQGGLADSERFISLPLAVFENVHFLQYQASIYRMYAKLSVIVHHDKALLNQWSRQGHSAMAKEKAAEELDLISSVDHDLELSWKNVRWVKQAVQLGLALGSSSHSASTSSSGNLFGSPISSVSSIAATAGSSSVPSADAKNELFPLLLPSLNLTLGTATSTVSVGSATSDSDSNI
ncbi:hypothetical protein, variant [Capsaspora owczarzaki ATCC 30864]|nr:hypothetical protein, variant [Capsaspora owczarzaki ATCC 30864]